MQGGLGRTSPQVGCRRQTGPLGPFLGSKNASIVRMTKRQNIAPSGRPDLRLEESMPYSHRLVVACAALCALVTACSDSVSTVVSSSPQVSFGRATSTGPQVTSILPSTAPRDTTLDIQVNGSGFDNGSHVSLALNGEADARVRVNRTRYVKTTQLVANVTISADALADLYDVIVITTSGKKGIGTEAFTVTLRPELLDGGIHAQSVNTMGDIVGWGPSNATCSGAFKTYVWPANGSTQVLGTGLFCGSSAKEINNAGVILGALFGGSTNASGLWFPGPSGYVLTEIPPAPSGYRPIAGGINDANEVIGWGQNGAQLFWWSSTTGWLSIAVPTGSTACQVWKGINIRGEIVGRCTVGGIQYPYYWSTHDASPVRLPSPAGGGDAAAIDINDSGVIVGRGSAGAIRWTPQAGSYPSAEVLPDGGYGANASAIANDGSISGSVASKSTGYALPTMWLPGGGYTLLGLRTNGSWGDAPGISVTTQGVVVVGSERNNQALRWRAY